MAALKERNAAANQGFELQIERVFDAPQSLVWECWTEREHMLRWFAPESLTTPAFDNELRVGGSFRACMRKADGTDLWVGGKYLEIIPNERLVFEWIWEDEYRQPSKITLLFKPEGRDKTRLVMIHTNLRTAEARDGHREGWTSAFNKLAKELAR
jgi:uncharacterized protein YndB with AHSA1/START domain